MTQSAGSTQAPFFGAQGPGRYGLAIGHEGPRACLLLGATKAACGTIHCVSLAVGRRVAASAMMSSWP